MVLNEPWVNDSCDVDYVIDSRIEELVTYLHREGFKHVTCDDVQYEFLNRCEHLYISSDILYPNEDLPNNFGVYRGYNGGGLHGGLQQTQIDRVTKKRQAKAQRVLDKFGAIFWGILKDLDNQDEVVTGEEKQPWDRLTI